MMHDQADKLRTLVRHAEQHRTDAALQSPQLIVLTGGKGGVGTTTLSVNLAVALAKQGRRVVLADTNLRRADVAILCGIEERFSVCDVLAARRSIHEVLQPGPAGIQVLPGAWTPTDAIDQSPDSQRRLIDQLRTLGRHAELVVLDAGNGPSDAVRRHWTAADRVLLVTTPDPVSIMDTYATVKILKAGVAGAGYAAVVNQSDDAESAAGVQRRLDTSCRRFLGLQIAPAGHLPPDCHVPAAARAGVPLMLQSPTCPAARAVDRVAAWLTAAGVSGKEATPKNRNFHSTQPRVRSDTQEKRLHALWR